jgi:porin
LAGGGCVFGALAAAKRPRHHRPAHASGYAAPMQALALAVGIAFAYGRISPQAAAHDRDVVALTGMPMPIRDYEAALELTYQVQLAQDWLLQPDVQYIIHPGGNVPNPRDPSGASPIPNATVIGMRTILKF